MCFNCMAVLSKADLNEHLKLKLLEPEQLFSNDAGLREVNLALSSYAESFHTLKQNFTWGCFDR